MNAGKCPSCGKVVDSARIEVIEPDVRTTTSLRGALPRGIVFVCKACNTMLPVSVMHDTKTSR
jgi:hypothetical protein